MYGWATGLKKPAALAVILLLLTSVSSVLADQVTLSWVDAQSQSQTLTVDANASSADLSLAASLLGEFGVNLSHDPANGTGTLAEIAAAMAGAAPVYAADIADALSSLSPGDTQAIVAAVNAVPGVNPNAVLAAVHFGPHIDRAGPRTAADASISTALPPFEQVPSRN